MNLMWFGICATFGLLMNTMDFSWDSWQFMCIGGLLLCSHYCGKIEAEENFLLALEEALEKSKKE